MRGVKYITIIMLAVAVLFIVPAVLYILEGGPGIAILPFILAVISIFIAIGLYLLKKFAWIAAIIIGIIGAIIFIVDCFNQNIESFLGAAFSIILLIGLFWIRKYYLTN